MLSDPEGGGGALREQRESRSLYSRLNNFYESTVGSLVFGLVLLALLIAVVVGVFIVVGRVMSTNNHPRVVSASVPQGILPQLPTDYSPADMRRARYMLLMGDGYAVGSGVPNVDRDAYFSALRKRYMPRATVLRLASGFALANDLTAQREHLATLYPNGLDGSAVAVIFAGGEDIVNGLMANAPSAPQVSNVAHNVANFASGLLHNASLFPHGVFVFTVDYPDPTNAFNFIDPVQQHCIEPLDAWLNYPSAYNESYTRAFDLFAAAMQVGAAEGNFAHVPLRHVLRRHGFNRVSVLAQSDQSMPRSSVLVAQSDEETGPLFGDCLFLNIAGQRHLADLLWSHINNQPYFQLY